MSLIVLAIAAAAVGVSGGALAVRRLWRRRARQAAPAPAPTTSGAPPSAAVDPASALPIQIGDVVQHGAATRWPGAAIVCRRGQEIGCALLLSREQGKDEAIAVFAPPERAIYWLERTAQALPASAPSRLDVAGELFDRIATFPATLEALGGAALPGATAVVARYEAPTGRAALAILGDERRLYHGVRLGPDDYEVLGRVDG